VWVELGVVFCFVILIITTNNNNRSSMQSTILYECGQRTHPLAVPCRTPIFKRESEKRWEGGQSTAYYFIITYDVLSGGVAQFETQKWSALSPRPRRSRSLVRFGLFILAQPELGTPSRAPKRKFIFFFHSADGQPAHDTHTTPPYP